MDLNRKELLITRPYRPDDYNFILATWLRGLYYGNDWFKKIPKRIYMDKYHQVIDKILTKPTIEAKVSALKEDPEVVLGYSIFEGQTLHWVFVKKAWRGVGIAKDLIPSPMSSATHLTDQWKLQDDQEFNPFLI